MASGASGAGGDAGPFDVSDVDVTNFPDVDCDHSLIQGVGCSLWRDLPGYGFAGGHYSGNTVYLQLTNPPTDEAGIEALNRKLDPCYDVVGECTYTDSDGKTGTYERTATTKYVYSTVKYDWDELWGHGPEARSSVLERD